MDLKYAIITLVLVYYCSALQQTEQEPPYVKFCQRKNCLPLQNNSRVLSYCNNNKELTMDGRCCIHDVGTSNITLGMDLSNCGINALETEMFSAFNKVEILMLQNNSFPNFKAMDFVGLTNLTELYLPLLDGTCPGGSLSWGSIEVENEVVKCFNEEDTCTSHNLTCPTNSYCTTAGPGSASCPCKKDYYGYKCMRTGHFPVLIYGVTASVGIVTVSVILFFLRRASRTKA